MAQAQQAIDLCNKAAELNYSQEIRNGNVIELPAEGTLIVTGDLHGHRRNFERITAYADLINNPDTHLVFQEILHGGADDGQGGCLSFEILFDILKLRIQFPDRVHIIMGNHDTAIITDSDVLKAGREMNIALKSGLKKHFGDYFEPVNEAIKEYLLSQPLAIKTDNKIWISHSLPADRFVDDFDYDVLDAILMPDDLLRPLPAYLLTWGRKHSDEKLEQMAKKLGIDNFILGHQKQDTGVSRAGINAIILTSEHNHGCLIALDMSKSYSVEDLMDCVVPLASIVS